MSVSVKLQKAIEKAVRTGTVVTVVRNTDEKSFTGKLVAVDVDLFTVRTGKRGRPVKLTAEQIKTLTPVA